MHYINVKLKIIIYKERNIDIFLNQLTKSLTHEEAIERAKNLAIKIKPRFKLTEELSRQPQENIQDFIDSGLVRTMTPRRWGGHELDFITLSKTAVEIAKADPSRGWCYARCCSFIHGCLGTFRRKYIVRFGRTIQMLVLLHPLIPFPTNKVISVEGGYQLNGEWGFSSGIDHGEWVMVMGFVDVIQVMGQPIGIVDDDGAERRF